MNAHNDIFIEHHVMINSGIRGIPFLAVLVVLHLKVRYQSFSVQNKTQNPA